MPIPFRLDYVIERTLAATTDEQSVLRELTGIKISSDEARAVWPRILDHKWYISERLGRDVGFRVAAIDYVENIWSPRTDRPKRGALKNRLRRAVRPMTLAA
ncbi:MAG: adenylate cyclase [Acidobacteriota bacterium]|nr:adenylate cyclase [Acidobacteriota bacterium]